MPGRAEADEKGVLLLLHEEGDKVAGEVVLEGVEGVLADEGDQEPAEIGAVQRRNPLDAVEVGVQNDLALGQRGDAGVDDLLKGGLLLGRPLRDGEVMDEQAQVGEGLLGPVLQVEDAVAVIAEGEPDGAGDDEHAGEVGGQVVMEAVGDIAAQLLNELGSNLLGTLRLPLHLLQTVFGIADQEPEGGEQGSPEYCPDCHGKEGEPRYELCQKECRK